MPGRVDTLRFAAQALLRQRFRSAMVVLAMAFGVAAVMVLTAAGEGARRYVLAEFAFLGKDILVLLPGRKETTGGLPPLMGTAARDITLPELEQLQRRVGGLKTVVPIIAGAAEVSHGGLLRETMIVGSTPGYLTLRKLELGRGRNLSERDFGRGGNDTIIGPELARELFGTEPALGKTLRVGESRFRVVGVLAEKASAGGELGDDLVIPAASAQRLFNLPGVLRALLGVRTGYSVDAVKAAVIETMRDLHQGEYDVTVVSPDAVLATFNSILRVLTLGVAAIGGISLLVAGILTMNVMMISISQRRREIGILKALGASSADVLRFFLSEALALVVVASLAGLAMGSGVIALARWQFPAIDFVAPLWAPFTAVAVALVTGVGFAWLPARRASRLLPVEVL